LFINSNGKFEGSTVHDIHDIYETGCSEQFNLTAPGLSPSQMRSLVGCPPCQRFDAALASGSA
jgi:hypothetical protein